MNSNLRSRWPSLPGPCSGQWPCKGCTLKPSRKPTVSPRPNWSMPRPEPLPRLSRLRKRLPVLACSALVAEGLLQSRGRRLPSVWPSPSGTAWRRRRHSTTRKPGRTLRRSVTRQSRQYGGTSSKPRIRPFPGVAAGTRSHTKNWQQLRLPRPPHWAASSRD